MYLKSNETSNKPRGMRGLIMAGPAVLLISLITASCLAPERNESQRAPELSDPLGSTMSAPTVATAAVMSPGLRQAFIASTQRNSPATYDFALARYHVGRS